MIFETSRLKIEEMNSKDENELLAIFQNPDFFFALALQNNIAVSEAANRFVSWAENSRNECERKSWFMSIRTRENIYIGAVVLMNLSNHSTYGREIEIMYFINNNFHNQGYASEATSQVVKFAKDNLRVRSIYATADPNNIYSCKILERLGLKQTGFDQISKFKTRSGKHSPRLNYRMVV